MSKSLISSISFILLLTFQACRVNTPCLNINQCEILELLSNEKFIEKNKSDFIYELMSILFRDSGLRPHWEEHKSIVYSNPTYTSYSLNKSIYKIDLLRLYRYYRCSDSTRLKDMTTGEFSKYDREILLNKRRNLEMIDGKIEELRKEGLKRNKGSMNDLLSQREYFYIDTAILYN